MQNVLTVDVEDWYTSSLDVLPGAEKDRGRKPDASVVPNTDTLLGLLAAHRHSATFFVLGTVAEHYPEVVRAIQDAGHEVGLHGYDHRLVYDMTPDTFRADLQRCRDLVQAAGVNGPFGYRAPYFSITRKSLWAIDVLAEEGIAYDASIFPISRSLYGIPDAPTIPHTVYGSTQTKRLWEFPPSTVRLLRRNLPFSGGGYLRVLPYPVVRQCIKRVNARNMPAIMYMHPYELDPDDTAIPNTVARGVSYHFQRLNRERNPRKIRQLLSEFEFVSIRDAFRDKLG